VCQASFLLDAARHRPDERIWIIARNAVVPAISRAGQAARSAH
jgi:hypothetical protein